MRLILIYSFRLAFLFSSFLFVNFNQRVYEKFCISTITNFELD